MSKTTHTHYNQIFQAAYSKIKTLPQFIYGQAVLFDGFIYTETGCYTHKGEYIGKNYETMQSFLQRGGRVVPIPAPENSGVATPADNNPFPLGSGESL